VIAAVLPLATLEISKVERHLLVVVKGANPPLRTGFPLPQGTILGERWSEGASTFLIRTTLDTVVEALSFAIDGLIARKTLSATWVNSHLPCTALTALTMMVTIRPITANGLPQWNKAETKATLFALNIKVKYCLLQLLQSALVFPTTRLSGDIATEKLFAEFI